MQFLTRVLIVLAVLGGLGYGSYAFGKYILSARLFGPQAKTTTTTASTGTLQQPSTADVEVVPAPQQPDKSAAKTDANDAPEVGAQPVATPNASVEITPSDNGNDSGKTRDSTDNNPDPTPRPRRRRHRARPTARPESRPVETPQVQAPPARTQNVDPPARDNNDNNGGANNDTPRDNTPRVEAPRNNDPVPAPTRRRERRTVPIPEPRDQAPRQAAPRLDPPRRDTSPVPVPEGARSGGGSSPVPIPG